MSKTKTLSGLTLFSYLTNGVVGLERFPLSFKTICQGHVHRHVVLGVYYSGRYGAIGMSRREDLMYKPLEFKVIKFKSLVSTQGQHLVFFGSHIQLYFLGKSFKRSDFQGILLKRKEIYCLIG